MTVDEQTVRDSKEPTRLALYLIYINKEKNSEIAKIILHRSAKLNDSNGTQRRCLICDKHVTNFRPLSSEGVNVTLFLLISRDYGYAIPTGKHLYKRP